MDHVINKTMTKQNKLFIIIVVIVIILSNTPPIQYFFQENYHYQNRDGSFEFTEQSGPTQGFDVAQKKFESFKIDNPLNPNKTLYRTFIFKPWRFWEWREMIQHWEKYKLPQYENNVNRD